MPVDGYRITCMIDFNSPVLGSHHASITNIDEFSKEIASSRTFCFLHALEALISQNLIKGVDLSNAIVIVDKEIEEDELEKPQVSLHMRVEVAQAGSLTNSSL